MLVIPARSFTQSMRARKLYYGLDEFQKSVAAVRVTVKSDAGIRRRDMKVPNDRHPLMSRY
jgi:hypothetical protein